MPGMAAIAMGAAPVVGGAVLGDAGSQRDPINRSNPLWTVTFEQPGFQTQVRSVTTAWFAGN